MAIDSGAIWYSKMSWRATSCRIRSFGVSFTGLPVMKSMISPSFRVSRTSFFLAFGMEWGHDIAANHKSLICTGLYLIEVVWKGSAFHAGHEVWNTNEESRKSDSGKEQTAAI
ncbi:MAG: hypothetical protein WCK77_22965 [Verrucomicrobiota bacterium]